MMENFRKTWSSARGDAPSLESFKIRLDKGMMVLLQELGDPCLGAGVQSRDLWSSFLANIQLIFFYFLPTLPHSLWQIQLMD